MVKIRLKDDILGNKRQDKWWLAEYDERPKGLSTMSDGTPSNKSYYSFIDEIHNWFMDNNIYYRLDYVSINTTDIIFKKESDAILFKLTWM
jgi:hypothetical protein